jgi:addiction module RelB/DinJ family antitoxin
MARTAILRARVDPQRMARVEKILRKLGLTPTQAVNMLFAQIERRRAIPFAVAMDNSDILPSDEHYRDVMKANDE